MESMFGHRLDVVMFGVTAWALFFWGYCILGLVLRHYDDL
jgi:hypothetical protein